MEDTKENVARMFRDREGTEDPAPWRQRVPWRKLGLVALAIAMFVWPLRVTSHGFIVRWAPPIVDPRPTCLDPAEKELVGEWSRRGFSARSQLSLSSHGTFHHGAGASLWHSESAGTWRLDGNELVLSKQDSYWSPHGVATFWSRDSQEERIRVVRWGERTILFEFEFELDAFVRDLNANRGEERVARWGLHKDGELAATGRPGLPSPWKERLLPGAIQGTILEVLADGRVRASLGSRDGVWTGMTLYRSPSAEYPWPLEVVATQETECVLKPPASGDKVALKPGDPVSSR